MADALEIRNQLLELAERNIDAYNSMDRTLNPAEVEAVEIFAKIVNETIKDQRWVEKNSQMTEEQMLSMVADLIEKRPELLAMVAERRAEKAKGFT